MRVAGMTRPVDARTDQYVEDVVALDPLTATLAGIPGHDDRHLPDLSPSGYDAREELNRRALAEVAAIEPTDERELHRQGRVCRAGRLKLEQAESGFERSASSAMSSAAHGVREVFDLMPTASEDDLTANRRPARSRGAGAGSGGLPRDARGRGGGRPGFGARKDARGGRPDPGWTGQEGAAGDYFGNLVVVNSGGLRDRLAEVAAGVSASYADFGRFVETTLLRAAGRSTGSAATATRSSRATSSAPRARPRGDLLVGLGVAEADRRPHGADRATRRPRWFGRRRGGGARPRSGA